MFQQLHDGRRAVDGLAGGQHGSFLDGVDDAQLDRIHVEGACQRIHRRLDGVAGLYGPPNPRIAPRGGLLV